MPVWPIKLIESLKSIEEMADWVSDVINSVGFKEASLVGHSGMFSDNGMCSKSK